MIGQCLRPRVPSVLTLLILFSSSVVFAQAETVEAKIVSVNLAASSVDLAYQEASGKKQCTLDVSKAKSTINGEPGILEGLRKGQKATSDQQNSRSSPPSSNRGFRRQLNLCAWMS